MGELKDSPLVELIQVWGSDLNTVNSARCSFGKEKRRVDDSDVRLIRYLSEHNHHSPFRHSGATFRITCPIFVARQIMKHRISVDINEISGRYVEMSREDYWKPAVWRQSASSLKQGSSDVPVDNQIHADYVYEDAVRHAYDCYFKLLKLGTCREQARAVLPQSMLTQFWMTASLQAWAHFYKLRIDSHAQRETQEYARLVGNELSERFEHSWKELTV